LSWRQDLPPTSREEGRPTDFPPSSSSRPNSFLSLESSDLGSEDGNRSDLLIGYPPANQTAELVEAPQTSTPVKDMTPTNEELADGESGPISSLPSQEAESVEVLDVDTASFVTSDC